MNDRQPTIDLQTWEALFAVYTIVAAADNGNRQIEPSDLAYAHAKLEDVLIFNSLPAVDPRSDAKVIDKLKALGRRVGESVKNVLP